MLDIFMEEWQEQCKWGGGVMALSWESEISVPTLGPPLPVCVTPDSHPISQSHGYLIFLNETTKQDTLSAPFLLKNSIFFLSHQLITTSLVQNFQYARRVINHAAIIINTGIIITSIILSSSHHLSFISEFITCTQFLINCRPVSPQTFLVPKLSSCLSLHGWDGKHCSCPSTQFITVDGGGEPTGEGGKLPLFIPGINGFCFLPLLSDFKPFLPFTHLRLHFLHLIL